MQDAWNARLMYERDARRRIEACLQIRLVPYPCLGSSNMKDHRKNVPEKSRGPIEADELADTQQLHEGPRANVENDGGVGNDDETRKMPALSIEKIESMLNPKK
jgi:hypothetical protein